MQTSRARKGWAGQVRAEQIRADRSGTKHSRRDADTGGYLLLCGLGAPCWCSVPIHVYIQVPHYAVIISNRRAIAMPWVAALQVSVPPVDVSVHGSTHGLSTKKRVPRLHENAPTDQSSKHCIFFFIPLARLAFFCPAAHWTSHEHRLFVLHSMVLFGPGFGQALFKVPMLPCSSASGSFPLFHFCCYPSLLSFSGPCFLSVFLNRIDTGVFAMVLV
jgi:hypothetical protein